MATKPNLISILRARGVVMSDSKARKTSIDKLEAMIAAREGCTCKTSPDERVDDLLTEGACLSLAEDWSLGKRHGVPEAGGFNHDDSAFIATLTDGFQVEVDRTTGKVRKLRRLDPDLPIVEADAKVFPLTRAASMNRPPKPAVAFRPTAPGSKRALMAELVLRPDGAAVEDLMGVTGVTGWNRSTAQGAITEDLVRGIGLGMRREGTKYFGRLPEGIKSHVRVVTTTRMAANTAPKRKK
jgi:hypothetical protein